MQHEILKTEIQKSNHRGCI